MSFRIRRVTVCGSIWVPGNHQRLKQGGRGLGRDLGLCSP